MKNIVAKMYVVEMEDKSKWAIPIANIAINRAEEYKGEFGDDLQRSLEEDTIPLFESGPYEIHDWAANNMNWSDIKHVAVCVSKPDIDYEDGWCNGKYSIED